MTVMRLYHQLYANITSDKLKNLLLIKFNYNTEYFVKVYFEYNIPHTENKTQH